MKTLLKRTAILLAWLVGARDALPAGDCNVRSAQFPASIAPARPNRICEYIAADGQTYLWIYHNSRQREVLREIGRLAADPASSFAWHDAAVCCKQVKGMDP